MYYIRILHRLNPTSDDSFLAQPPNYDSTAPVQSKQPIVDIATDPWLHCPKSTKGEKIGAGIGPIVYPPDISHNPWLSDQVPIKGDTVILEGLIYPFLDDVPALVTTAQLSGDRIGVVVIGCNEEI